MLPPSSQSWLVFGHQLVSLLVLVPPGITPLACSYPQGHTPPCLLAPVYLSSFSSCHSLLHTSLAILPGLLFSERPSLLFCSGGCSLSSMCFCLSSSSPCIWGSAEMELPPSAKPGQLPIHLPGTELPTPMAIAQLPAFPGVYTLHLDLSVWGVVLHSTPWRCAAGTQ